MADRPRVLILTGMSGAGRSSAAKILEDIGYLVVDNLPPSLIDDVVALHNVPDGRDRLALVVDSRTGLTPDSLRSAVNDLAGQGIQTSVLFLDAEDGVLLRRYGELRRPHPVPGETLPESVASERRLLTEIRGISDVVIDTSAMLTPELKTRIGELFAKPQPERPMQVSLTSFGYKNGTPRNADLVFDVRFLPNPHWVEDLRPLTGMDQPVSDYVLGQEDAAPFLDHTRDLLGFLLPRYAEAGKSYLTIGVGCTGGRHRSVAMAEELARWLSEMDIPVALRHRDLEL